MKQLLLIVFSLFAFGAFSQNKINQYEYWFDNDYANKTDVSVTSATQFNLNAAIPTSSIGEGFHVFHSRFRDDSSFYSTTVSQFFFKPPVSGTSIPNKISSYEYWFDDNYAGKYALNITPTGLFTVSGDMASTLSTGMHVFHMRFKDITESWSNITSNFIYKPGYGSDINAYEYWFDNDYAGNVFQAVADQNQFILLTAINSASLNNGMHIFNIRFRDKGNTWSTLSSTFFFKNGNSNAANNILTSYRYWFDSADSAMHTIQLSTPINIYSLTGLDLTGLPKGYHTMHMQFLDTLENWSCITTDTIYKYPEVVADFTPDNYLFCDSGWVNFTNNSFDADTFRWEFDDATTSTLVNPMHYYNTPGTHPTLLIAYDTLEGVIDSAIVDISVAASPIVYLGHDTAICPSTITLDAWNANCTYHWSNLATDSVIHVSTAGTYSVTVTNQWGCFDIDTIHVFVNPAPTVDLGNDTVICQYNTITLDAGPGNSIYLWCSGGTSQTVIASFAGTYCVTVTNAQGCTAADSINITTDPCTSISDISGNNHFELFPNPNNGIFSIHNISDIEGLCEIAISDMSGRVLDSYENLSFKKDEVYNIDDSELASGIYLLKISSDTFSIAEKIIINH